MYSLISVPFSQDKTTSGSSGSSSSGVSSATNGLGGGGLVEGYERGPLDAAGLKMSNGNGSDGLRSRSISGSSSGNENGSNGQSVSYQSITAAEQSPQQPQRNSLKDSSRLDDENHQSATLSSSLVSATALPVPPASIRQLLRSPPVSSIILFVIY